MKIQKRNTFGSPSLLIIAESESDSRLIDECFSDQIPTYIIGKADLSDGYGDHYISLRRMPCLSRDDLGRVVRDAWIQWAKGQLICKPSWTTSYDNLPEDDKEVDRQIGEAIIAALTRKS
jgi:hypothetical protein